MNIAILNITYTAVDFAIRERRRLSQTTVVHISGAVVHSFVFFGVLSLIRTLLEYALVLEYSSTRVLEYHGIAIAR